MLSKRKYLVEMDGRSVFATRNYKHAKRVAWRLIHRNQEVEIMVHLYGLIVDI